MKSILRSPQSIVLILVLIITSCKHNNYRDSLKNPSPFFTNFFTGSEENVLRDVNFNISQDELKKIEKSKLYESTPDHLFYEFSFPTDSTSFSEYANVQYFFNEDNELDIMTADIYLNDSSQQEKLNHTLTDYYNLRFGNPEKDENDHSVWKAKYRDKKTDKKINYSIALKELEDEYGVSLEYVRE